MAACLQATLDERLFLLVEKFRELYDKTHSCYKDVGLKENIRQLSAKSLMLKVIKKRYLYKSSKNQIDCITFIVSTV